MRSGWIGSHARALSIRIDQPLGQPVGAVVFVPTIGREAVVSSRTQKAFCLRATDLGFLGVSFAFSGDGDSSPATNDDDIGAAWINDIERVVAATREMAPGVPVHAVGLRLGAALLSQVQLNPGEVRVLWEPASGSSFLNRHIALRRIGVRLPPLQSLVELSGFSLTHRQAQNLRGISVAADKPGVIVRKEGNRETGARIASVTTHAAKIPVDSIDEILSALPRAGSEHQEASGPSIDPVYPQRDADGVLETHVVVGPQRLAGILTEPKEGPPSCQVVFTAMGAELKCGPGNLWTSLSRMLSQRGATCLRIDRTELGDSIDPSQLGEPRPYRVQAVRDLVTAAEYLKERSSAPVIGVGVCAAGWLFMKAAAGGAPINHILCVNNIHWNPDPRAYDEAFYEHFYHEQAHQAEEADDEPPPVNQPAGDTLPIGQRLRAAASDKKHQLAVRMPRLRAFIRGDRSLAAERPGRMLGNVPATTAITLAMGPWEYGRFAAQEGVREAGRLNDRGRRIKVVRTESVDHSLLSLTGQQTAADLLQQIMAAS